MLINGAIGQARVIPSGSMENTLLIGDHLIMSRLGYDVGIPFTNFHLRLWRNPKRQQIVIFRPVIRGESSDVIKRVIGLPAKRSIFATALFGSTAEAWSKTTRLAAPNLWIHRNISQAIEGKSKVLPYTVPKDCYFMMGDNRGNSLDSRFRVAFPAKISSARRS